MITINFYYGFTIIHNGKLNKNQTTFAQEIIFRILFMYFHYYIPNCVSLFFFLQLWKNDPLILSISSLLYSPSSSFFILIHYIIRLIFFSSMSYSRCCSNVVGQPSVPSCSPFPKVMMNKDFWGFLSYSDKLSIALNVIVSSGLLWIYQEDLESILRNPCILGNILWQLRTQIDVDSMVNMLHLDDFRGYS